MMGVYCEGSRCKKRDKCALHCVGPGEYEFIDWSTYGSGEYWNDPDGTPRCKVEHSCGDNGEYKNFVGYKYENVACRIVTLSA